MMFCYKSGKHALLSASSSLTFWDINGKFWWENDVVPGNCDASKLSKFLQSIYWLLMLFSSSKSSMAKLPLCWWWKPSFVAKLVDRVGLPSCGSSRSWLSKTLWLQTSSCCSEVLMGSWKVAAWRFGWTTTCAVPAKSENEGGRLTWLVSLL